MITKIDACKIKHQPNIKIFVWDRDNHIQRKPKQIKNHGSKLTKYQTMKLNFFKKINVKRWNQGENKRKNQREKKNKPPKST
jgi:hypothetical protein